MIEIERLGPAFAAAMPHVTDLVCVIDADARLEYVNPYGVELFGHDAADALVGSSLVDVIHPDDLTRVLAAMARMLDPTIEVPGRPVLLRIRRADGSYLRVEANGAAGLIDGRPTGRAVVMARPSTDADLHELLMQLLTTGAPSAKSFELVPDFGR